MEEHTGRNELRSMFDAIPSLVFIVDEDVRIHDYNAAAANLLKAQRSEIIERRGGEAMHCINASATPDGCGRGPACRQCVIRNAVGEAMQGNRVVRRRRKIQIERGENKQEIFALITASPFQYEQRSLALLVIEDIGEIAEFQRMIPICSVCRKIRDEKQSWFRVEAYFKDHWDVDFSHGLCPECYEVEKQKLQVYLKAKKEAAAGN